jgi:hypothetical protein
MHNLEISGFSDNTFVVLAQPCVILKRVAQILVCLLHVILATHRDHGGHSGHVHQLMDAGTEHTRTYGL